MARLPTVGGDNDNWGTVLNDYLSQAHNSDGTLRAHVATIADLKALDLAAIPNKMQALVCGYHAHDDQGGGQFYYDAAASEADNGGTIIAPTSGSGRWKRVYSGAVNVKWFGAKGDGTTNDTIAISNALASVCAAGGALLFPPAVYMVGLLASTLAEDAKVVINGYGATILSTNDGSSSGTVVFTGSAKASLEVYGIAIDHVTRPDYTDGNGVDATSALAVNSPSRPNQMTRAIFKDIHVRSGWWAGIRPYRVDSVLVEGCTVERCRGTGIFGSSYDVFIVTGCTVSKTSDDGIFCAATEVMSGGESLLRVQNNAVYSVFAKGIGYGGYRSAAVTGNSIKRTRAFGIGVESGWISRNPWGACEQVVITENIIDSPGNGGAPGTRHGISLRISANAVPNQVVISSNCIQNAPASGIRSYAAKSLVCAGNAIISDGPCVSLGIKNNGIRGHTDVLLTANVLKTRGRHSVVAYHAVGLVADLNRIEGHTSSAFYLDHCASADIREGNKVSGSVPSVIQESCTDVTWSQKAGLAAYNTVTIGASPSNTDPPRLYLRRVADITSIDMEVELSGAIELAGTTTSGVYVANMGGAYQPVVTQYCPVVVYDGAEYSVATLQICSFNNGEIHLYGQKSARLTTIYLNGVRYRLVAPA